jgi:hypothetical protein
VNLSSIRYLSLPLLQRHSTPQVVSAGIKRPSVPISLMINRISSSQELIDDNLLPDHTVRPGRASALAFRGLWRKIVESFWTNFTGSVPDFLKEFQKGFMQAFIVARNN